MEILKDRILRFKNEKDIFWGEISQKLGLSIDNVYTLFKSDWIPNISVCFKLTDIFKVNIITLLTGEPYDEKMYSSNNDDKWLGDINDQTSPLHLISKDDATLFKQYGYTNLFNIFHKFESGQKGTKEYYQLTRKVIDALYEHKAINIFKECLLDNIVDLPDDWYETNSRSSDKWPWVIYGNSWSYSNSVSLDMKRLNKYISLCIDSNYAAGLKAIDYKHNYRYSDLTATFKSLFTKNVKDVLEYMSKLEFKNTNYNSTNEIMLELYKNKHFELLDRMIVDKARRLEYARESYYKYENRRYRPYNNDKEYSYEHFNPIKDAFNLAKEEKDIVWLKKFNDFNLKLKQKVNQLEVTTVSNKDMQIFELEWLDSKPLEDILVAKHTKHGVLDLKSLLNDDCGLSKEEYGQKLTDLVAKIRGLKPFIIDKYISYNELIKTSVKNNMWREVYQFAIDLGYNFLADAVIAKNVDLIYELADELFMPNDYIRKGIISHTDYLRTKTAIEHKYTQEQIKEGELKILESWSKSIFNKMNKFENSYNSFEDSYDSPATLDIDTKLYKELLTIESQNFPLLDEYNEFTVKSNLKKVKENFWKQYKQKLEDVIESITNEKAMKNHFEKINNEFSSKNLLKLLNSGNIGMCIINIYRRLEAIFAYKYKYKDKYGDNIHEWINKYFEHEKVKVERDSDYYNDSKIKELEEKQKLLHKLRKKRNDITHGSFSNIDKQDKQLSNDELKTCINLLDTINEGAKDE